MTESMIVGLSSAVIPGVFLGLETGSLLYASTGAWCMFVIAFLLEEIYRVVKSK